MSPCLYGGGNMARERSEVTVEFVDGEVRKYIITASPSIAGYLAQEMQGGALRMSDYDSGTAVVIPSAQIKQIGLRSVVDEPGPVNLSDRAIDYDDSIADLDRLSTRAITALRDAKVNTVRDLITPEPMTEVQISALHGAGRATVREILDLQKYLISLGL